MRTNMAYTALLAVGALSLAACQTTKKAEEPAPIDNADSCGASKVTSFVGQELTAATRLAIQDRAGTDNIRWIAPNSAVTMDYRQDRLNVNYNSQNIIEKINCG